jgi:hypothetical protein
MDNKGETVHCGGMKSVNNHSHSRHNIDSGGIDTCECCCDMSVLIKYLENSWTIKKNVNFHHDKNEKEKEYILKKTSGRSVKIKIVRLKENLKKNEANNNKVNNDKVNNDKVNNDECEEELSNIKRDKKRTLLSDICLRNFIYNALENEWKLKKRDNKYFCSKRHKGDKRVYEAGYLKEFLLDNLTL